LPGAEVLDRFELEALPASAPCWPPGLDAWVIYPSTDGVLYRFSFEESAAVPRPLRWRCPPPWGGRVAVVDATWPSHPGLAATMVVALRHVVPESEDGPPNWVDSQLWWLRLDPDGMAIVGAGRLIDPAPDGAREELAAEHLPVLAATPDGGLALAYIARRRGESEHRLRLAPVAIDASTGAPHVEEPAVVEVADGRAACAAAFSSDGRWLYSFPDRSPLPMQADRTSVVEALARKQGPTLVNAPRTVARGPGSLRRPDQALILDRTSQWMKKSATQQASRSRPARSIQEGSASQCRPVAMGGSFRARARIAF
jgi:hypothetical protein